MTLFQILAILLSLSAVFAYLNARYLRLPTTIGIMVFALGFSLVLVGLQAAGFPGLGRWALTLTHSIDFDETLLKGMLSFLLFAGALHVNLDELAEQRWTIGLLATVSVVVSTFLVGTGLWYLLGWLGAHIPYAYCLLFGAIISPTDPIAVLAILKSVGAPQRLYLKIAGESLFNDATAVVAFLVISGVALGTTEPTLGTIATVTLKETGGGVLLGLIMGYVAYLMIRPLDNYQVEILITLAVVTGGYALASAVHVSGPLAVVVAGLMIGNHGRRLAMSETTVEHLDTFWELADELLNSVLFLIIGLEILVIAFTRDIVLAGIAAIPLVLVARFISVGLPITAVRRFRHVSPGAIRALTWGGLRGGVSVALALSLPAGPERDLLVGVTYVVVVFSILVQGLTMRRVIARPAEAAAQLEDGAPST